MSDEPEPGGASSTMVIVEDEQAVPVDGESLRDLAVRALAALGVPAHAELSITLVGRDRIAELKQQAFGVHAATDVLSFPMDDLDDPSPGPLMLGDLVLCPDVARRQARALGRGLEAEMEQLVVHGLLHLLGRDHQDPKAELAMASEEHRILSAVTMGGPR